MAMNLNFERIPLWGISVLILSALPALYLCTETNDYAPPTSKSMISSKQLPIAGDFSLPLSNSLSVISHDSEAIQINYSVDPPRPSTEQTPSRLLIRLGQSKQIKRVELPAKVGLEFTSNGSLQFNDHADLFWLTCDLLPNGQVEAFTYVKTPNGYDHCKANCSRFPEETPFSSTDDISAKSPFKLLAESRWWGQDLLAEKFGNGTNPLERIEIGPEANQSLLEFSAGEWLVFKENQWQTNESISNHLPIARVKNRSPHGLEMEGWEGSSHLRFKILPTSTIPLRTKGEELFSQLRVRSEKQVSCIIDKQCLILRTGDWVLKANNRWKILRKKEEKDAFLAGNMTGDLFVLEKIDSKGTTKSIAGQLFSTKRSQSAAIEFIQPLKNNPGPGQPKGKAR